MYRCCFGSWRMYRFGIWQHLVVHMLLAQSPFVQVLGQNCFCKYRWSLGCPMYRFWGSLVSDAFSLGYSLRANGLWVVPCTDSACTDGLWVAPCTDGLWVGPCTDWVVFGLSLGWPMVFGLCFGWPRLFLHVQTVLGLSHVQILDGLRVVPCTEAWGLKSWCMYRLGVDGVCCI